MKLTLSEKEAASCKATSSEASSWRITSCSILSLDDINDHFHKHRGIVSSLIQSLNLVNAVICKTASFMALSFDG